MNMISVSQARILVATWRETFPHAPASVCLTLMELESSFNAQAHAIPSAALARVPSGGAWGLMQVLYPTAMGVVDHLQKRAASPEGLPQPVRDALSVWDPARPDCLLHPALGSLIGVAYLDELAVTFGPGLDKLAAAYHNGPGFLHAFLHAGKVIPEDLPPFGREYVTRARRVFPRYADADNTPPPKLHLVA